MNKIMNKLIEDENQWNHWFAGLTDGDGCFYITKDGYVSFELTTHTTDARVVYLLKNKLKAGTVSLRSGSCSVRYRVKAKATILDIVNRLNGKLYNPTRVQQFIKVCNLIGVDPIIDAYATLSADGIFQGVTGMSKKKDNKTSFACFSRATLAPYISGIIDSAGSLAISVGNASAADSQLSGVNGRITRLVNSRGHNQIRLKVTTSYKEYATLINHVLGIGKVYREEPNRKNRSPNPKYHWTLERREDFLFLYEYLKQFPLRSVKMHRIRLALLYFKYKELGYHLQAPGTLQAKIWAKFARSWYKYSY